MKQALLWRKERRGAGGGEASLCPPRPTVGTLCRLFFVFALVARIELGVVYFARVNTPLAPALPLGPGRTCARFQLVSLAPLSLTCSAARTQKCAGLCSGSPFFNTQYGIQCWCGDADTDFDQHGTSNEAECDIPCAGNAGEDCGGFYWASVYSTSADAPTPTPGGGFTSLGCFTDVLDDRYCRRELYVAHRSSSFSFAR